MTSTPTAEPAAPPSPEVSDDGLFYVFKPSLVGAPHAFRLAPDGLEWQIGRRSGQVPYRDIKRVRLLYRPANMQTHRFITEVHAHGAPKLKIVSVSWRSLAEQQRQDEPYSVFIVELHRRIRDAGAATEFHAGPPALIYWPGLVLFVGFALAMAVLIARAISQEIWAGAALVAAFLGFFLWQMGNFLRRNRPGTYRPDAIPEILLPRP